MRLGASYKLGPFELADLVGLDTQKSALATLDAQNPDNPTFKPIAILNKLVESGKLGRKTGEGFYKYKL